MATCPACGANIQHATTREGTRVPLEIFTEPQGTQRYRVLDAKVGAGLIVEQVREDTPVDAYPDHRKDCVDYGNGLTR